MCINNMIRINTCRICLRSHRDVMITMKNDNEWLNLFKYCFGISISQQDEPKILCKNCAKKLEKYSNFKKLCLKSDYLWKNILNDNVNCSLNKLELNIIKDEPPDDIYNSNISIHSEIVKYSERYNVGNIFTNNNHLEKKYDENNDAYKQICELKSPISQENSLSMALRKKIMKSSNIKGLQNSDQKVVNNIGALTSIFEKSKVKDRTRKTKVSYSEIEYYCGLCELTLSDSEMMEQHFKEHIARNDLVCQLCNFVGVDFAQMVSHRYKHILAGGPHRKVPRCPCCSRVYKSALSIQFHYRKVHMNRLGGYCTRCKRSLMDFKSFKEHVKNHTKKNFICDHCGKTFAYRFYIKTHMELHMEPKFVCDQCGKKFNRRCYLKAHMLCVHTEEEKIKCNLCSKIFKSSAHLKYHFARTHGDKKHKCDYCGKSFFSPLYLKKHIFFHSGEKPHRCEICNAHFKTKSALSSHIKRHRRDFDHKCDICEKVFCTKNELNRHSKVHVRKSSRL